MRARVCAGKAGCGVRAVLVKRCQARVHAFKHFCVVPGAQRRKRQRWALQQRAFGHMLPALHSFCSACARNAYSMSAQYVDRDRSTDPPVGHKGSPSRSSDRDTYLSQYQLYASYCYCCCEVFIFESICNLSRQNYAVTPKMASTSYEAQLRHTQYG